METLPINIRSVGGKLSSHATACNPNYRRCVEWLGAPWGHAVAPSTPVQDYRLHVKAWQHHFAAIFGFEALSRVRGFSPSEMALPNHPDVAYEFAKTLKDCGYQWVLVQEHTVEEPADGWHPRRPHLPHRLVCTNSKGETARRRAPTPNSWRRCSPPMKRAASAASSWPAARCRRW